jgi:uncharacterized RDD family membrane protein YckC
MSDRYQYAGFWVRTGAAIIDSILTLMITTPLLILYYGFDTYWQAALQGEFLGIVDLLVTWIFPLVVTIWFWLRFQATPGKILFSLKVLDEQTGSPLTLKQSLLRYLGYFASIFGLMLGFVWIAFDAKKQGWHDKIAKTVVVKDASLSA